MSLFDDREDDDNIDFLAELTGPGKKFDRTKYASDEEMYKAIAKGKYHGDKTLDLKLQEFDELREEFLNVSAENKAKAKFEEFFKTQQKKNEDDTEDRTQNPPSSEPKFDPEQIDKLLEAKLTAREAKQREDVNMDQVEAILANRFGDSARRILKDKMKQLNFTVEDVRYLAKKSPEAAINALGLNQQSQDTYTIPPRSSQRSDNFSPQTDVRDAIFYENMRQKDKQLYFSEKMSVQRLKDMEHPDFLKRFNARQAQS